MKNPYINDLIALKPQKFAALDYHSGKLLIQDKKRGCIRSKIDDKDGAKPVSGLLLHKSKLKSQSRLSKGFHPKDLEDAFPFAMVKTTKHIYTINI